jgi:hypothetical protein
MSAHQEDSEGKDVFEYSLGDRDVLRALRAAPVKPQDKYRCAGIITLHYAWSPA